MMTLTAPDRQTERRDALAARIFRAAIEVGDLVTVYLGDRLGWYRALAEQGPATSAELAARTATAERYAREWLEQQAVTGILQVDDPAAEAEARRYRLPAGHAEVLLDAHSLSYLAPLARLMVGCVQPLPQLLQACRDGSGVPYAHYGADAREGIADLNRPMYLHQLGREWLPAMPDIHARLQRTPPARVADIGCGTGWSSIAIARAYPHVWVAGFDEDAASIERARANVRAAGVADRVAFAVRDAADPAFAGRYDLVTAFECVHDMARPVEALQTMRRLLAPGGAVLIADERVAERFTPAGDEVERLNYNFSVLHCLPAGLATRSSVGTGTVMRPRTLREYAEQAGFQSVEVLPIEHDLWRFYRLHPGC